MLNKSMGEKIVSKKRQGEIHLVSSTQKYELPSSTEKKIKSSKSKNKGLAEAWKRDPF